MEDTSPAPNPPGTNTQTARERCLELETQIAEAHEHIRRLASAKYLESLRPSMLKGEWDHERFERLAAGKLGITVDEYKARSAQPTPEMPAPLTAHRLRRQQTQGQRTAAAIKALHSNENRAAAVAIHVPTTRPRQNRTSSPVAVTASPSSFSGRSAGEDSAVPSSADPASSRGDGSAETGEAPIAPSLARHLAQPTEEQAEFWREVEAKVRLRRIVDDLRTAVVDEYRAALFGSAADLDLAHRRRKRFTNEAIALVTDEAAKA